MSLPSIRVVKLLFLVSILVFAFSTAIAQRNGSVKGIAYDSISKQSIGGATVTLLKKKDSSLVSFTMTDNKGLFSLDGLADGDYRLLLTHINYHNRSLFFSVSDTRKEVNLGNAIMYDLAQVLAEVTVTAEAPPVTLIGDTIQYNAGSFKTPPNANVEQLLKNMPSLPSDATEEKTALWKEVAEAMSQKINKTAKEPANFNTFRTSA